MRQSHVVTAIIWLIGFSFLALFLFPGLCAGIWNWGILLFVVAFLGWGLQRSTGYSGETPPPAIRVLRNTGTALVSGIVFMFTAIFVLMSLGTKYHDNYEYYGNYPALFVIPGMVGLVVGFFLASMSFRTFGSAVISGVVCFFAGIAALSFSGLESHHLYPALFMLPGLVGLFLPSLLVLVVRKVRSCQ